MEAERFAAVGESDDGARCGHPGVGRPHRARQGPHLAAARLRGGPQGSRPRTRLRIVGGPPWRAREAVAYLAHCRALAAQLFPDEAADAHAVGENPVSFEEIGGPEAPGLPDAYASGSRGRPLQLVEGFPISLVEAMFCGRATVSTDVGAVVEVIGGTGLVVPPRNPRALADACVQLLRDPERGSGSAPRPEPAHSKSSPSSRTSPHSAPSTWNSSRTPPCGAPHKPSAPTARRGPSRIPPRRRCPPA